MQELLELVEKLQQTLQRAEMLPEVEAEQAPRVAALSMVPLWVPRGEWGVGGGAGTRRACSRAVPPDPARAAVHTGARMRGSCCPFEMGALPECQAAPASVSPSVNFPPVVFCVSPGRFSSESLLLKSSVSHSKPSRIET